ncbi:Prefoldin beta-like [Macleaya cordata]|uniref:Prefoldin beta-like n=1 Tax=Macleaya cordata TaxID=56857 RepID=A0A200R6S3_MACCD|nr:Prefoldin beta-like [Macleaya cordata]
MANSGVAAASPASSATAYGAEDSKHNLLKQMRSHEVSIAELNSLSSSRAVYQKNGNLFFRTTVQKVVANEQRQLALAKAKLQQLNST